MYVDEKRKRNKPYPWTSQQLDVFKQYYYIQQFSLDRLACIFKTSRHSIDIMMNQQGFLKRKRTKNAFAPVYQNKFTDRPQKEMILWKKIITQKWGKTFRVY